MSTWAWMILGTYVVLAILVVVHEWHDVTTGRSDWRPPHDEEKE